MQTLREIADKSWLAKFLTLNPVELAPSRLFKRFHGPDRGIIRNFLNLCFHLIDGARTILQAPLIPLPTDPHPGRRSTAVFWATTNQFRALEPVIDEFARRRLPTVLLTAPGNGQALYPDHWTDRDRYWFDRRYVDLAALLFLPFSIVKAAWAFWRFGCPMARKRRVFDEVLLALPRVLVWTSYIKKLGVEGIVVANDHSAEFVSLLCAARLLGVKTFYLQHAHINRQFPALSMDVALLDGELAARAYTHQPAKRTRVYLTGAPRLSPLIELRKETCQTVGIALSMGEFGDEITPLIDCIISSGFPDVVRLHPREPESRRLLVEELSIRKPGLTCSDASVESVATFLSKVGVVVAGDSSIHMEAFLGGRPSFYMHLNKLKAYDYYGFCELGLARAMDGLETIVQALRDPRTADALEPSRLCATVGTKFERCPERLMVELISALLEGEATEGWSRDPSFQSEVYRFAGD